MILPTGYARAKFQEYPRCRILNTLVVVTVATADAEILVSGSAVKSTKWDEVVGMPSAINWVETIETFAPLLAELIRSPAFKSRS